MGGGYPTTPYVDGQRADQETQDRYSPAPEVLLAQLLKSDLNIDVNPQALRMFVRTRFNRLSPLTHAIHNA